MLMIATPPWSRCMNVLVIDVGGTNVKILATGQEEPRQDSFRAGDDADQMVANVKESCRRLEVRRGIDRLSGLRAAGPAYRGAV